MTELFFWYIIASSFKIFDCITTLKSPNLLRDEKNELVLNELKKSDSPRRKLIEITLWIILILTIFLILGLEYRYLNLPQKYTLVPFIIYFFQFVAGLHVSVTFNNVFFLYFPQYNRNLNMIFMLIATLISIYLKFYFFFIGWFIQWKFKFANKLLIRILN